MWKIPLLRLGPALGRMLIVILLPLLVFVSTLGSERTYHVAATTWGGEITLVGETNDWWIAHAKICRAREEPDLRGLNQVDGGLCPAALFEAEKDINSEVIHWGEGTRIHFELARGAGLVIRTLSTGTDELPPGSRLVIPSDAWNNHGALVFTGLVIIGGAMGNGAQDYLIDGTWEARQIGLATSLFREITEVVQRGELSLGASVEVVDGSRPVVSYGHITPAAIDDAGLELVALSEPGRLSLKIAHYGLSEPSYFRPDWMDTISSSPMLIALAIVLTLVLTILQLVLTSLAFVRGRRGGL